MVDPFEQSFEKSKLGKKSDEQKKEEDKSPAQGRRSTRKKFYIRGMLKEEGINIDEDVLDRDKDPTDAA